MFQGLTEKAWICAALIAGAILGKIFAGFPDDLVASMIAFVPAWVAIPRVAATLGVRGF